MSAPAIAPSGEPRVLLVSPPWSPPGDGSLALATLRPILEEAGVPTAVLHGSLLFPRGKSNMRWLDDLSGLLFAQHLHGTEGVQGAIDAIVSRYLETVGLGGVLSPSRDVLYEHASSLEESRAFLATQADEIAAAVRRDTELAGACLDGCLARILGGGYDIVGFSMTFEAQIPAALVLATRLKVAAPHVRVMFGGAACAEAQGEGLAASFAVIDAVCCTEGDEVIVGLVRALAGGGDLASVPGVAFRQGGAVIRTGPPPLLTKMDRLPIPDYGPFTAELAASEWRDLPPKLYFETSRGCWWGAKSLCSFCGLNGTGLSFRSKSPARAFDEIRHLAVTYPEANRLHATDNILATSYFDTLLPRLARERRERGTAIRLFFEIKSNLKRRHVQLLAEAGIDEVQPGIESFHDGVLRLMRKGNTGLGQIQFIKWAAEEGVRPFYNVLIQSPNERPEWYREMAALVPFIDHLPPPNMVQPIQLERFSPYYLDPQAHGIRNVRPKPYYGLLFAGDDVDRDRLAYHFDYDHDDREDPALRAAQRQLALRVVRWNRAWRPGRVVAQRRGNDVLFADRRGAVRRAAVIRGVAARLFRFLDRVRSRRAIDRELAALDPSVTACLLDTLEARRWVCRDARANALAVVPAERPARTHRQGS